MIWWYKIGFLLNGILLIAAAFNLRISGAFNKTLFYCMFLVAAMMGAAYICQTYLYQLKTAVVLLWLPLIPVILCLLFLLLAIIIKPDFK